MNDWGLNLSLMEMMKGFLFFNIRDKVKCDDVYKVWRKYIYKLESLGKEEDLNFIKNWF